MVVRRPATQPQKAAFEDFSATHLLCPKCRTARPVRERLLLILPDGELYDYICTACGTSAGTRKAGR
ncbi:MAG: hypothetical protein HY537_18930 [Deltaproteobacteria bacterium]|nr:hypothetical protein [Deltaproteobacteria bacterium]